MRALEAYTLAARPARVKINQNENPFELPEAVKREVLEEALRRPWGRYPDFDPQELLLALARFAGWTADGVLAGNGSNELIQALLLVTVGAQTRVVIPEPTFTLYGLLTGILGGEVVRVRTGPDLRYDAAALVAAARERRGGPHHRLLAEQPHGQPAGDGRRRAALPRDPRPGRDRRGVPRVRGHDGGAPPRAAPEPRGAAHVLEGDGPGGPARGLPAGGASPGARDRQGPAALQPELLLAGRGPRGPPARGPAPGLRVPAAAACATSSWRRCGRCRG